MSNQFGVVTNEDGLMIGISGLGLSDHMLVDTQKFELTESGIVKENTWYYGDRTENNAERFTLNEEQLFKRLCTLESEKLTLAADIAQLKKDAAYDEDDNPKGIAKDEIKLIAAAAKLFAKQDFEERKLSANQVFAKYQQLTGYDD